MGTIAQELAPPAGPVKRPANRRIWARLRALAPDVLADSPPWARVGYGLLAVFVVAYVVSVVARDGNPGNVALDGWAVAIAEVVAGTLCLSRLLVRNPPVRGRGVVLGLGLGLLAWATGDVVVAARFGAATTPAAAQIAYLGFYPLAYVAIVLLMRQEVARLPAATWLDGALAGLGAAAVCAAFAFKDLLHSTHGSAFTTATNLAYPIGDVLLLALVVGGTAMLPGRGRVRWLLVATACSLNAVGDTFNLLHNSVGASPVGQAFNATAWPVAILLMSVAMWTRASTSKARDQAMTSGFVLPGLAAAAGLVILTVGSLHHVGAVAVALAAATLTVAGIRLAMSVSTLRGLTAQRHRESITDELTGLGNRRQLSQLFESLVLAVNGHEAATLPNGSASSIPVAPRSPTQVTPTHEATAHGVGVLFVDLDHFKEVNDSFGHAVGDELLRQMGPRLESSLRKGDLLVRLGGDEFAVVLPGADDEQAFRVAERLAACLDPPFYLDMVPVQITASIGIAIAPRDGASLNDILRCADLAMYRAKLLQVQVQIYDRAFDDAGDLLHLAEELREAVDTEELVLHYQPQLDLRTRTVTAVEALIRWEHPRLGTIPPLKFLPLAEESGLMPAITSRVLNDALEQCAAWRAAGHELVVSVNISASNLLDPGFVECVAAALERWGTPPEALVLEITETSIISDYDRSREVIDRLQQLGLVMSIDDFGAGFTSLAHLSNLAVGELKLDRAFVARLGAEDGTRDVELLRSTIDLGHALGLRIVAEGIETAETLKLLSDLGCDVAQGYLISRPVPADRLELAPLSPARRTTTSLVGSSDNH